MEEIPFKVSAKAARLIGRENIANAEGAVGELVKNSYDADATICIVAFLPRGGAAPLSLNQLEYERLEHQLPIVTKVYDFDENSKSYEISGKVNNSELDELNADYSQITDLWIIDNGNGMTANIIRENWMVIGTDFKEKNKNSASGRRLTGAKGIGRFAMDKLGERCSVTSYSKKGGGKPKGILWSVDWGAFEDPSKTLDQVQATMRPLDHPLSTDLSQNSSLANLIDGLDDGTWGEGRGTFMRISDLRDQWSQKEVQRLQKFLTTLAPPTEQRPFSINLYVPNYPSLSGEIDPVTLNDFDYRMDVSLEDSLAKISLIRNELRANEILDAVFDRDEMKRERFTLGDIRNRTVTYNKSISALFPKIPADRLEIMKRVGDFSFTLYFIKRGKGRNSEFPYRAFQPGPRKIWLDEYGGVKIYRDGFFVRPYGEIGGKSFDWLGLGERVAGNPAGAGRKGWRVNPQQIAGTVHLTMEKNPQIADQTNREGIIENEEFEALQALIMRFIQEFEDDRSHIMSNIKGEHDDRMKEKRRLEEAAAAADEVDDDPDATPKEKLLAEALKAQKQQLFEAGEDQRLMQSLATLGTVLVSFTHEIAHIKNHTADRTKELTELLIDHVKPEDFDDSEDAWNPYVLLDDWAVIDEKVNQWFSFALTTLRSERRRRRDISLQDYFKRLRLNWKSFLNARDIKLFTRFVDKCQPVLLAFEIDLDSIFNNLLVNSIEALTHPSHKKSKREIRISVEIDENSVLVSYWDNGPGIDDSVESLSEILNFNYSTKYDDKGNPTGTGLGLWMLESAVRSNGGDIKLFRPSDEHGFRIDLALPNRGATE